MKIIQYLEKNAKNTSFGRNTAKINEIWGNGDFGFGNDHQSIDSGEKRHNHQMTQIINDDDFGEQ